MEWIGEPDGQHEYLVLTNSESDIDDPQATPFDAEFFNEKINKTIPVQLNYIKINKSFNFLSAVPDTHNNSLSTWDFSEGDIQFPKTSWRYSCNLIDGRCDDGTENRYDLTCKGGELFDHQGVTLAASSKKVEVHIGNQKKL